MLRSQWILPCLCMLALTAHGQPAPTPADSRGLVALPQGKRSVFLAWRLLPDDPQDATFRLYRSDTPNGPLNLIVETPWTSHLDQSPDLISGRGVRYQLRVLHQGKEVLAIDPIPVVPQDDPVDGVPLATDIEPEVQTVDARRHVDRCVPADLDGDGVLDYVVIFPKNSVDPHYWKPSKESLKLRAINGRTGRPMWTFDLGKGIEMGVWYSPFVAYDLDGDGKAEVVTKTNDRPLMAKYKEGHRVIGGAERLTVLDGVTGEVRAQAPWPNRGGLGDYNQQNRNLLAVAYLDGQRPAVVVNRGTYQHAKIEAWLFDGRELSLKWMWSTLDEGMAKYAGSGAHNSLAADIDGDGMDEFFWGCVCLDGDGEAARVKWAVWMPGQEDVFTIGHVDTLALGDIRPDLPGPEVYYTIEHHSVANLYAWNTPDPRRGAVYVQADGTPHWVYTNGKHVHSGATADVLTGADHPGWECYYAEADGSVSRLCAADGSIIADNFQLPKTIEWDGDEAVEIIDENGNIHDFSQPPIFKMGAHAWVAMAIGDFVGDYREEMIVRRPDGSLKLLVNTTPIEARRVSPLYERTYRLSLAAYGSGYTGAPSRGGRTWMRRAETQPASDVR